MGLPARGQQWRQRRGAVPVGDQGHSRGVARGGGQRDRQFHGAWRWLCALPWLAMVVLAILSPGAHWDPLAFVIFVIAPGLIAAAIVAAPSGGWLVLAGLVASADGALLFFGVVSLLGWIGTVTGGQSHVNSGLLAVLLIPLASGLGTVFLGILELAQQGPRISPR
jgi:hypothetical protein